MDYISLRQSAIDEIVATGRIVMVIGRVDTGKSTFCRHLASAALKKGLKVGMVDSDVGQSWIGPPTTVGMKMIDGDIYPAIFPDSFYFVGSITPERHLLQTTVGAKRMLEAARNSGADLVIIDTTGLVDGSIGRALKSSKIDLIKPDHIVCFQRNGELEMLIRGIESDSCHVYRLEPSKSVEKKSQEKRCRYRQEQFSRYFSEFISHEFHFSQLRGQRDIFLNGRRANEKELENISEILADCRMLINHAPVNDRILYAEWFFRGLFIVAADRLDWSVTRCLCSYLKIEELASRTPDDYSQLLVALADRYGNPLCLGIIEKIDFNRSVMTIKCKKDSAENVRMIQFSSFKI